MGLIGNGSFLFTVARVKRMRTIPNLYLALQSVSDLLFILLILGVVVWRYLLHIATGEQKYYNIAFIKQESLLTFSEVSCFFNTFFKVFAYSGAMAFMTIVSFDRFLAIVYPLKYQTLNGKKLVQKLTVSALVFSLINGTVQGIPFSGLTVDCYIWPKHPEFDSFYRVVHRCTGRFKISDTYFSIHTVAVFVTTLLVNSIFYLGLIRALSKRSIGKDSSTQFYIIAARNQVAKLVIINGVLFLLCQFPPRLRGIFIIIEFFTDFKLSRDFQFYLRLGEYGTQINAAMNALIFPILSSFYRQGYIEAFRLNVCWSKLQRQKSNQPRRVSSVLTGQTNTDTNFA